MFTTDFGTLPYFNLLMAPDDGDAPTGGSGGDAGGDGGGDTPPTGDDGGGGEGGNGDAPTGDDDPKGNDGGGDTPPTGDNGKPAPQKQKTDDPKGDGEGEQKKGIWSDNWREDYAGEDEKMLAYLNRFTSPKALIDKVLEQDKVIRSGGHKKEAPGEDASDEEKAAYRKEIGVPEKPEGYLDNLPEGLVLGDAEKESAEGFLKRMHDMNVAPEVAGAALDEFMKHEQAYVDARQQLDADAATNATQELKEKWGSDYQANINALENFINNNFPSDVQEIFRNGRLGDESGTPILSHPGAIEALARIERELNPQSSVVSSKGIDTIDSINEQIAAYEKRMGSKDWYADNKAQEHYRELVTMRERMKARGQTS